MVFSDFLYLKNLPKCVESSKPSCHAISLTVEIDFSCQRPDSYIDLGGQFPVMVKIPLQKDQIPYGPGNYYVHPSSFRVSGYSDLQVSDIVLVPSDEK